MSRFWQRPAAQVSLLCSHGAQFPHEKVHEAQPLGAATGQLPSLCPLLPHYHLSRGLGWGSGLILSCLVASGSLALVQSAYNRRLEQRGSTLHALCTAVSDWGAGQGESGQRKIKEEMEKWDRTTEKQNCSRLGPCLH